MPRPTGTLTTPMTHVIVYSTTWCPWCDRAKALLDARGIAYDDVNIETQPDFRQKLVDLTGGYTVPQIVVGEKPIGGFASCARSTRAASLPICSPPSGTRAHFRMSAASGAAGSPSSRMIGARWLETEGRAHPACGRPGCSLAARSVPGASQGHRPPLEQASRLPCEPAGAPARSIHPSHTRSS